MPAEQSLMVLVPEAYRNHPDLVKKYNEVCTSSSADRSAQHPWHLPACSSHMLPLLLAGCTT